MNTKAIGIVLMVAGTLVLAACAGAPAASNGQPPVQEQAAAPAAEVGQPLSESNVGSQPLKATVLDWSDRTMGQEQNPAWLKPLVINGNAEAARSAFGLASGVRIKFSMAERENRDEARVLAGLMFAQKTAQELKQYVCTAAASRLDEGQMDIVEEITTATKVTMTGNQRVADFWQLVESENPGTKAKSQKYVYYIVWSMEEAVWSQLVRKYVNDVIGQVPDRPVQIQVANAFADIDAAAKREEQRSDAAFQQQLDLQAQAARDAQERAMAGINAQTQATQAAAGVAEAQARADARARAAAYRSGDPAVAAAASTTAADIDWISALTTAGNILVN
jgi:urease beta subunit